MLRGGVAIIIVGLAWNLYAGGSGLNTMVVVNQTSADSVELGNYYCERRQVPPENVLRINWPGGNISWSAAEFQTVLLTPLLTAITERGLTAQIDYVALSMDIPFQTRNGADVNSTTSALFYGLKSDSDGDGMAVADSYAGSEQSFRQVQPARATEASFLTTMITGHTLAQAKQLVDQGVNGDGSRPRQPVLLAKSSDPVRNLRHREFDNAIFNTRLSPAGNYTMARTNADIPATGKGLLGLQTGLANFTVGPNAFVPGAMADSLTSFGGMIFGPNDQTSLLAFIEAGASGSYGTVTEPLALADKFPDPQAYFYQSRGFNLAECYYQSLRMPYQGLIVGEPLTAPWRKLAVGEWSGIVPNAVVSGATQLTVSFHAADPGHPLQQIDLFVDGKFNRTITNLPPQPGNVLSLNLNHRAMTYVVPTGATLESVARGLASLLNASENNNATRIAAFAHGDRVELHATSSSRPRPPRNLRTLAEAPPGTPSFPTTENPPPVASSAAGSAALLSTFVTASRESFLNSSAAGRRGFTVNGIVQPGTRLGMTVTKINGESISVAVTNQSADATAYQLAGELVERLNATPALQGVDGVVAEDCGLWFSSGAQFNLYARSPGLYAARVKARLTASGLALNPIEASDLTENLSDLQPRNHLYVSAGAANLTATFDLDTTTLADGFHELTAVAYEGSSVRTESRITLPVRVQNSAFSAIIAPLDLSDSSAVAGTYHIQIAANANDVASTQLFSTGGLLSAINNQRIATFTVSGASLGAGQHPFYAVVETKRGLRFRTETRWIRLKR